MTERGEGAKKDEKPIWAPRGKPLAERDEQAPARGPVGQMAKDAAAVRREALGEKSGS